MNRFVTTSAAFLIGFGVVMVACSSEPADSLRNRGEDGENGPDGGKANDGVISPSGGSVRAPYQVKTSAEIASAIGACFGNGVTTIRESMIQTVENPAGFLPARQFSVDGDIVAFESPIIDGDPSVERVGVRNSNLSLPILAALQDIGNVVGENCAAQDNASCDCATPQAAHDMLLRCLPGISPDKFAGIEGSFAETCAKDRATAISSLLASTAFGVR